MILATAEPGRVMKELRARVLVRVCPQTSFPTAVTATLVTTEACVTCVRAAVVERATKEFRVWELVRVHLVALILPVIVVSLDSGDLTVILATAEPGRVMKGSVVLERVLVIR